MEREMLSSLSPSSSQHSSSYHGIIIITYKQATVHTVYKAPPRGGPAIKPRPENVSIAPFRDKQKGLNKNVQSAYKIKYFLLLVFNHP